MRSDHWAHLLDGVAPVAQDALAAVDEADAGDHGGGIHIAGVVHAQADAVASGLDLAQVRALDCTPLADGKLHTADLSSPSSSSAG